jgi:hypothetical protein
MCTNNKETNDANFIRDSPPHSVGGDYLAIFENEL